MWNIEKHEKWEMHIVGPGIWRENSKSQKMRNTHFRGWNMARKTEKVVKFRNVHSRTWNMARKLKKMENEKHPVDDMKNDEITEKREKWEMHTVGPGIWRDNWKSWKVRNILLTTWKMMKSLKNLQNGTCTLQELEYGEKTENHGKWQIHTLGLEIWQGKLKKVESLEMSTVGHGIWQENWRSRKMRIKLVR
jgi:hypothetical protein